MNLSQLVDPFQGATPARFVALDGDHGFRLPEQFNRAFFRDSVVPNL